jgi:hypothetical protein
MLFARDFDSRHLRLVTEYLTVFTEIGGSREFVVEECFSVTRLGGFREVTYFFPLCMKERIGIVTVFETQNLHVILFVFNQLSWCSIGIAGSGTSLAL